MKTIGILSPGDMGSAVGRVLGDHGFDVLTCLRSRSDRTKQLAGDAGILDVETLEELVTEAELVLSILVPADAVEIARKIAAAIDATDADVTFSDCNAISPQSSEIMESIVTGAGGRYIDGSIIGGPPGRGTPPRFYVSGVHSGIMSELDGKGIEVRNIGDTVGRASGIKMCYAAMTKGTSALHLALLSAAEAMGLSDELANELSESQPEVLRRMQDQLPGLPSKSYRWIGEMQEIAETFDHSGVTPAFHQGAAEIFRLLSETPLARETPENIDRSRTLSETISALVAVRPAWAEPSD